MIRMRLPDGDLYLIDNTDADGLRWKISLFFEKPEVTERKFRENFVQYFVLRANQ